MNRLRVTGHNSKTRPPFLLDAVGLKDVVTYPIPIFASSSEDPDKLKDLAAVPRQMIDIYKNEIIAKGFMNESEYDEGIKELERWLEKTNSFWMILTILTVGVR